MQFATKLFEKEYEMAKRFYIFMGKNLAKILREISALTNKELLAPFDATEEEFSEKKDEEVEDTDPQCRLEESFHQIFSLDPDEVLISRL